MKCEKPNCYNDELMLYPHALFGRVCRECHLKWESEKVEIEKKAKRVHRKHGKPARRRVKA